jgi:hypothetical protein
LVARLVAMIRRGGSGLREREQGSTTLWVLLKTKSNDCYLLHIYYIYMTGTAGHYMIFRELKDE